MTLSKEVLPMSFGYKVSFIGESDHLIAAKPVAIDVDDRERAINEACRLYPDLYEKAARVFAEKATHHSTVNAKAP